MKVKRFPSRAGDAGAQCEVMSEHTSNLLSLNEPALAPLRRGDLASFLVLLPDARVIAATAPCAALGISEDLSAPLNVKMVARHVGAMGGAVARLERVRLPSSFVPRIFSCVSVALPVGRAVLFADPLALAPGASPQDDAGGEAPSVSPASHSPEEPARPVRFTWEVDAQGALRALSASFLEALGPRLQTWHGRSFDDLAADGVLKDVAVLRDLMDAGATFSDAVMWTAESPPRRIEMGGVPLLDGAKRRTGFRGFGLIWAAPSLPPEPHVEPALNVVPLRGGALSPRERSAFHEIARTLNEAIDAWPKPGAEPPPALPSANASSPSAPPELPPVAPAPPPPHAPAQVMENGLLDRLPIGLAIQQRGVLVYVNATLLAWAGCADLEAFRTSGGLSGRLTRERPDAPLELQSVEGGQMPVEVRLLSAPWRGETAIAHVVRAMDPPASPPPARAPAAAVPPVPQVDVDAERARARSQALDLIPLGVFLLDPSGAIEEMNAMAAELCGFLGNELRGEPFTLLFASASQGAAVALLDGALKAAGTDAPGREALTLRHRLGDETAMEATLVRAQDAPPRLCLVLRTLSAEEKTHLSEEAEMSVSRQADDGPSLSASVGEETDKIEDLASFVRRVSHAVRTPLTDILGFVDVVRSSAFGPMGNSRYAKQAEAASVAGQQLLASLEDMEQLIPLPSVDEREVINVSEVVDAGVLHAQSRARRRRVLIRQDVASTADTRFSGAVLARALRLLLEEAVRATPAGGQVIVSVGRDASLGEGSVIMIRDDGAGLTEEEIAQALSPLCAAPVSDRFGSAGLPFRMARIATLLQANGATLTLRRGIERGMLCEIRLPG